LVPEVAPNILNSERNNSRWIRSFFRDGGKKKKAKSRQIGAPSNFQHLAHIGFDPVTGFDVKNIPPEWKILFDKAGVTKEQLENKDTAKFIVDFVQSKGGPNGAAATNPPSAAAAAHRGPPPPPPSKSSRGPPPPPPARTDLVKSLPNVQSGVSGVKTPEGAPPTPQAPLSNILSQRVAHSSNDELKGDSQKLTRPPADGSRHNLLQSIRDGGGLSMLKPAAESPAAASQGTLEPESTDLMASLLAKALADRNKKIAHSDSDKNNSDDDDDDSEW
jgi:hypothetical protein